MPSRPIPQSEEITIRSGGLQRLADDVADLVRPLDLQSVVVDDAEHDLLVSHDPADRLEIAGARGAGFEGQRVGIDLIERLQSRLVALHVAEDALLCRVTPAGVAPHLGLAAQPFDRVVEYLDQLGDFEPAERQAARRHHVDLRLLHLDHRAAGVGERVELLIYRLASPRRTLAPNRPHRCVLL
jgi:hypothetical protein